jgi:regulator of PEP synthase PpsR (kinase-PPPase family)
VHIPFVDNLAAAEKAAAAIRRATETDAVTPLVFSTLTDDAIQNMIAASCPNVFDLFGTFINPLEAALQLTSSHSMGRMHGIIDTLVYDRRVNALNFTLGHDDGLKADALSEADVVLLGVSRCGKTPTCLYLAMHYYLKAANYPLTDDDFERGQLPGVLEKCRARLYGLTIVPEQLSRIRRERRADGRYATLAQCRREVNGAEALFRAEDIRCLDSTSISIEEIAATIVRDMDLHRTGH